MVGFAIVCLVLAFRQSRTAVNEVTAAPPTAIGPIIYEGWEETEGVASEAGFDYRELFKASVAGDQDSIAHLMRMSIRMDASAAYGHAIALTKVHHAIGDAAFARVAEKQSARAKKSMALLLKEIDYTPDPWSKAFRLKSQPLTAAALRTTETSANSPGQ